jgi:Na+/H+-dicarboxylate symporter
MALAKIPSIFKQLSFYTLLAILLAVFFGHYFPKLSLQLNIFSDWFIKAIKLFIAPIV